MPAPTKTEPGNLRIKVAYGLGSVAFGTKDAGFATFLLIYYNQVLGVPATLVSLAIMIALLADAIFDPIVGEISDNLRSPWGRRHPLMYGSAIPVAAFYFLLWNPPHLPTGELFLYLVGTAVLVRIAIATYEIPSAALVPELSADYDDRTSWMAYRTLFGALGNGVTLTIALVFFMVATKAQPVGILNKAGYFNYSIMAVGVMVASILISAMGTHSQIPRLRKLPPRRNISLTKVLREVFESLSNRSFVLVTIASLFGGLGIGMVGALGTYFGTYFWKFTPQQLSTLGLGALLGSFIALVLAPIFSKRFEKKKAYIFASFGSLAVNNVTMTLKLLGFLSPDGSAALLAIFFVSVTIGLALAIASFIIVLSMITDIVEDSELKTGRRSEGLFSASISFVSKATSGLGVLAAGVMIDLVHFPAHASPATIDPHIPNNLALIYMPTQMALFAISTIIIAFYKIDRKTHQNNLARLAEAAAVLDSAEETRFADDVPAPTTAPIGAVKPAAARGL